MSKKLQQKQQRRLAEEAKRARQRKEHRTANLITIGIAAIVAIAVIVLVVAQRDDDATPTGNVGVSATEANCAELETFDSEGNQHLDAGTPVTYQANPPTTGDHWPPDQVSNPGFFTEPVEPERLVHNQEHAQIVIWYNPNAPQEVIDDIEALIAQDRPPINIAVPWDDIEGPYNYVLSAWSGDGNQGVQMRCELASQQVWDGFREDYQGRGPEQAGIPTFSRDD